MANARALAEAFATFTPEELQRVCANFAEPKSEAPMPVQTVDMPNPTCADLIDPQFEAIWQATKTWDVNVPEHYSGYCGMNGSHVLLILNAIRAAK